MAFKAASKFHTAISSFTAPHSHLYSYFGAAHHGFTIVELLIVIVVIGILAALSFVAYNGITARATVTVMQSDLENAAKAVEIDSVSTGTYPASAAAANGGKGLLASNNNQLAYTLSAKGYCIAVTNPGNSSTYHIKSSEGTIQSGICGIVVGTLAGNSTDGYADGTGAAAQFEYPNYIAIDTVGNLYVSDNTRVRKVTPSGVVSTVAGSTSSGYVDGTGTAALFNYVNGITIDTTGNLYVTDANRIRKITSAGVVTTIAGNANSGSTNGTGTAATFQNPAGIVVDTTGNLYVADQGNHRIRKVTSAGVVTTFAGGSQGYVNATGTAASFNAPAGIAIDASGNLYVAESSNHRIRKITSGAVVTGIAGSGASGYADGTGTAAQFNGPQGITVDTSGNLYVVDTYNNRIRKVTSAGVVTTYVGSGTDGYADGAGATAQFSAPTGIAIDASGTLYVVDTYNNRIRKLTQ